MTTQGSHKTTSKPGLENFGLALLKGFEGLFVALQRHPKASFWQIPVTDLRISQCHAFWNDKFCQRKRKFSTLIRRHYVYPIIISHHGPVHAETRLPVNPGLVARKSRPKTCDPKQVLCLSAGDSEQVQKSNYEMSSNGNPMGKAWGFDL